MVKFDKNSVETGRINGNGLDWQLVERTNPDGTKIYMLNKQFKFKTAGTIFCSLEELIKLQAFMKMRRFEGNAE